ncbi:MAG: GGDEF domain-containing protein [Woeseia sp.]|nr:GGDEF domain-containing protein [Woeseia sp.]MBT8096806.1 GGDEF domain-containing protein [Woeseia sp.]NNE60375.1 GGDEF domain-containing protein [Woeseia sp.]NNL53789.1 GGDEF domain-containing protein [Woeseia sp.]
MHDTGIHKLPAPERFRLPLMFCAAGALGVFPFAVIRFINQQWWAAILDTAIVVGFIILGTVVLRSRQLRFACISISTLCLVGYISTLYMIGPAQVFWGYPAVVVAYYLLKPEEAVSATIATLLVMLPILVSEFELMAAMTIAVTMLMTSAFAYAFAGLTRGQRQRLLDLATRDPLTGTGNRRALTQTISEAIAKQQRGGTPASLIILDLDRFKAINDEYGHGTGDQILVELTAMINRRIRANDRLFRIGGEEFVVVADGQDIYRASGLAEQLRVRIAQGELAPDCKVTISLGVAELHPGETGENWLRRADDALYDAKRGGRNLTRVSHVTDGTGEFRIPAEMMQ